MNTNKRMTIGEMFTEKELRKAFKIMERYFLLSALDGDAPEPLNDTLLREVVTPEVMRRIDDKTGHENHAGYFCYVLQYAYTQSQGRMPSLPCPKCQESPVGWCGEHVIYAGMTDKPSGKAS